MILVYDAPESERRRVVLLSLEKLAQSCVDGFLLLDIGSLVVARVARFFPLCSFYILLL